MGCGSVAGKCSFLWKSAADRSEIVMVDQEMSAALGVTSYQGRDGP